MPERVITVESSFRTSTFSGGGGCVAIGRTADGFAAMRDSKRPPDALTLIVAPQKWTEFITGVKDGEFDL